MFELVTRSLRKYNRISVLKAWGFIYSLKAVSCLLTSEHPTQETDVTGSFVDILTPSQGFNPQQHSPGAPKENEERKEIPLNPNLMRRLGLTRLTDDNDLGRQRPRDQATWNFCPSSILGQKNYNQLGVIPWLPAPTKAHPSISVAQEFLLLLKHIICLFL